jgi:hypothetical protein
MTMPATLSTELQNAALWAQVYESRLEEFGKHYSECAHVTQKQLKAREIDIKRETYTQVLAWHTEGNQDCTYTFDRLRAALSGLDGLDSSAEEGSAPPPAPPPSPSNRGPAPLTAGLQSPRAAVHRRQAGVQPPPPVGMVPRRLSADRSAAS